MHCDSEKSQATVWRKIAAAEKLKFPAKFIDKYNDFIQYLNTHRVFHWDSFKPPICLSVCQSCLEVCPGAFELSGKQRGFFFFFITQLVAQWMGMTAKSFISASLCPAQSKRWLLFETWLPFLRSVKSSLLSIFLLYFHLHNLLL